MSCYSFFLRFLKRYPLNRERFHGKRLYVTPLRTATFTIFLVSLCHRYSATLCISISISADKWRVALRGERNDYIHAVFVHVTICDKTCRTSSNCYAQGYKQQRAFIIAQSPMESTARDFWKMVIDRKCGVIVMLCDFVEDGEVRHSSAYKI